MFFFFSSRRRHTRFKCDWSSDVCSSDLLALGDGNIIYGLASAWTFTDALKHAGKNLTRAGLMHALRSLNEKNNPFIYPGMTVQTSKKRTFPMEQLKIIKWSGGATGDWHPSGKIFSGLH